MHSSTSTALALPLSQTPVGADGEGRIIAHRYRLERLLGEGGMGSVWLARNVMLDLPVALKIVRPEVRGSDTTGRLLMEARVEASLGHPNVVRVFDCGVTDDGDAFIVMELLEGCSLGDLMHDQGALRPEFAVQLLLPVIHGLATAHQAGVIHRDLKPDNIFISRTGAQLCPKILDFGIAKLNAHEGVPSLHDTGRGMVMGSPAYMAPEQVRGCADLDERADVWALSVVLYEALTGKMAFEAENYNALLCEVLERDLPPLVDPDRAGAWAILKRGLARDRAQRIGSMRELGTLLANWLVSRGVTDDATGEPLSWHWRIGSAPIRVVPAPELPARRADPLASDELGIRNVLTERIVTQPRFFPFQIKPGAVGLGVCLALQLLMLGSSLTSNFRGDDKPGEDRVLAAATPTAAAGVLVAPRPVHHAAPRPAADAAADINEKRAPAAPRVASPTPVNTKSRAADSEGTSGPSAASQSAAVPGRASRTRATSSKRGSTGASSARAKESDLGLKRPW